MPDPTMPLSQGGALGTLLGSLISPIIFTALRFLGRRVERLTWWWDDWLILLSLLLLTADFWAALQMVQSAPASSSDAPASVSAFLLRLYITNLLHPLIITTTKLSALLLYLAHFGLARRCAIPTYILMSLSAAWGVTVFFASLFTCDPVLAAWAVLPSDSPPATCMHFPTLLRATSISDAVLNFLVLLCTFPGSYSIDWIFGRGVIITSLYLTGLFVVIANGLTAYYVPSSLSSSPSSSSSFSLPLIASDFDSALEANPAPSSTDLAVLFGPYLLWLKMVESFAMTCVSMYPAGFGLLALVTWNFNEPKERLFGYFRRKTRKTVTEAGLGALLENSKERREMEMERVKGGASAVVEMKEMDGMDGESREGKGRRERETGRMEERRGEEEKEAKRRLEEFRADLDREVFARSEVGKRSGDEGRKAVEGREMV